MHSGSPEAQNIRRRSRFLNALTRLRQGYGEPRDNAFTAMPKKLCFDVVMNK